MGGISRARSILEPDAAYGAAAKAAAPVPPKAAQPASEPAWHTLDSSAQWNEVDGAVQLQRTLRDMGYTGALQAEPQRFGYGEDATWAPTVLHADLAKFLSDKGYRLQARNVGNDMQTVIARADGTLVSDPTHYDTNDKSWFEKAAPIALGAAAGYGVLSSLGGLGAAGNGAFLGEGVASGIPGWDVAAGLGEAASTSGGLLGAGEGAAQLAAYTAANPLTAAQVTASTLPAAGLPGLEAAGGLLGAAGSTGNGAFLGEGVTSGVPAWDAAAGSGVGALGQAAAWMKANPLLGRLLTSGATSLLSASGGGGSAPAAEAPAGPPVQWNSALQKGLLSTPAQSAPPQIGPQGLLANGNANDGAWRYLKG